MNIFLSRNKLFQHTALAKLCGIMNAVTGESVILAQIQATIHCLGGSKEGDSERDENGNRDGMHFG